VIRSFRDAETKRLWLTGTSRRNPPPSLRRAALRKLQLLESATPLEDMRAVHGNRLEAMKGDRDGQFSIRINDTVSNMFHVERRRCVRGRNYGLSLGLPI
jgi:proteic killer suppression protein